jgi:hypothetical protein
MRNWINARRAGLFALILLALLAIFHLLVLVRFIPTGMVWGGQIEDKSAFFRMESLALVITLIFTIIIAIKSGYIRTRKFQKLAGIVVWVIFAYFLLNILGNLMSENATEKAIFTPVSILLAIFTFRLAIEKRPSHKTNHPGS